MKFQRMLLVSFVVSPFQEQGSNKKQAKKLAKQDVDFIYEKKSGKLYFNSNGDKKGFGDKGGFFGIVEGSPELSADDINLI